MDKLRALTAYLIDRQLVPAEQLDSFAEQVSLTLVWKPEREGLRLGAMRYRAVIILERLADHPGRLMALVGSWLESNDPDRDGLPDPVFDVEQMDPDLADVELSVEFVEPLHLAEDPAGEIEAFGQRWAFVPFDLWVAEHGEVIHG
ncbi:phage tail protein [Pseudomonas aeruginosa]|uniref:phage tail protein n=1 Tax=Pseudomonas aeruginosa TaxID=287 RepID=UPI000EB4978B|nr:phage tail protein [Pseudomonas aeruginosa]EIU6915718.1 phage tail protein [Pseudomonas aeruginosa]EKI0102555.1 phage tail protein [Pseudomonas aeruginosa]EKT8184766.1 phage tail protein [Pseudomonas aeruginosa]EKW9851914.1 phage tail protein [Pseudomonas aeruginosa]ELF4136636.1 phage tail protein [Pseudomonas aeruginosa]